MRKFLRPFNKYYIGIQAADGRKHCILWWYLDQRFNHSECPKGYHMNEFREDPEDEWGYIAYVEPSVWCDYSERLSLVRRYRLARTAPLMFMK